MSGHSRIAHVRWQGLGEALEGLPRFQPAQAFFHRKLIAQQGLVELHAPFLVGGQGVTREAQAAHESGPRRLAQGEPGDRGEQGPQQAHGLHRFGLSLAQAL
jgi:hypothetical protein